MTWTTRPRSEAGSLAAITAGRGPLVVLLHGVGLRAEAWNPILDHLAGQFRVVAPDMAGHGQSRPPAGPMGMSGYTDAVLPLLDEPAVVIGHSMGAVIALDLACRYPGRIRQVAALNAIFERSPQASAAVKARAAALDGQRVADPSVTLERWFGTDPSPEREACKTWLTTVDPASYKSAYTAFARQNGPDRAALSALDCPALFLTGSEEPNSTPAMSRAMAALAPRGRGRVLQDAAHMMPMTHAEQVIAELLDFLPEARP